MLRLPAISRPDPDHGLEPVREERQPDLPGGRLLARLLELGRQPAQRVADLRELRHGGGSGAGGQVAGRGAG